MGWRRHSYKGHEVVTHSGGIPGISTRVAFLPNDDFGVVVLMNADAKEGAAMDIVYEVVDRALGLNKWPRWKSKEDVTKLER